MDRTGIIEIEFFWSKRTCEQTIANLESVGFNHATVSTDAGEKFALHARNNRRVIFEDDELAGSLWSDLLPHIPMNFGNSKACGLNEMFRSYKYEPGQKFQKHRDQSFIRNESEASYFTVLIYLNEGFKGGETVFETRKISPRWVSV